MSTSTSTTKQHLIHHYSYSSPTKPHVTLTDNNNNNNKSNNSSSGFIFDSSSPNNLSQYQTNNSRCKIINPFITPTVSKKPAILRKQVIKIINESCVPRIVGTPKKSSIKSVPDYQSIKSSPPILVQKSIIPINDQLEMDKKYLNSDLLLLSSGSYANEESYVHPQQEEVYRNLYQVNSSMVELNNSKFDGDLICSENSASYELLDYTEEEIEAKVKAKETFPLNNTKAGIYCTNLGDEFFEHNNKNRLMSSPEPPKPGSSASHTKKINLTPERFSVSLKIQPNVLAGLKGNNTTFLLSTEEEEKEEQEQQQEEVSDVSSGDLSYSPTRRNTRNSTSRVYFSGLSIPQNSKSTSKKNSSKFSARSKSGCWTCRVRHKACPEEKPRCSQCVRLQLYCDYSETRPDYMSNLHLQQQKLREIRLITDEAKKASILRLRKKSRI